MSTSTLKTTVQAIKDAFNTYDSTVEVLFGAERAEQESSPPRIVLVPLTTEPLPARQFQLGVDKTRVLFTEQLGMVAIIEARAADDMDTSGSEADYYEVQELRGAFYTIMRAVAGSMFQLGTGSWEDTTGVGVVDSGKKFYQRFTLVAGLLDDVPGLANITNVAQVASPTTLNVGITLPGPVDVQDIPST